MTCRLVYRPAVERFLARMSREDRARVRKTLETFAASGRADIKKLQGRENQYRLRSGKWRAVFSFEPPDIIAVIDVDNRGEIY